MYPSPVASSFTVAVVAPSPCSPVSRNYLNHLGCLASGLKTHKCTSSPQISSRALDELGHQCRHCCSHLRMSRRKYLHTFATSVDCISAPSLTPAGAQHCQLIPSSLSGPSLSYSFPSLPLLWKQQLFWDHLERLTLRTSPRLSTLECRSAATLTLALELSPACCST